MPLLNIADCERLVQRALAASGAGAGPSNSTAKALVAAEADGHSGHGLSRVPSYAAQVRAGKVDGHALPTMNRVRTGAIRIDAAGGFAYPALDLAVQALPGITRECGVAVATIYRSHHIGAAGYTAERLAHAGCLGLVFANTPSAMPFPGGVQPMMGTNPIAFAVPVSQRAPLVIDMALAQVARGRIVAAQKQGVSIPADWALDKTGQPTTDPTAALSGSLVPAGGHKGAALALMVEILCGALAGGHYGWEASSFLDDQGPAPAVGQVLLAIDAESLSAGTLLERMTQLLAVMRAQESVRVPGDRRLANRARANSCGIEINAHLHATIVALAAGSEAG